MSSPGKSGFLVKSMKTVFGVKLLNFEDSPMVYTVHDRGADGGIDHDIYLYADCKGEIFRRISKSRLAKDVKKTDDGERFIIVFDTARKRTYCLFEKGILLDVLLDETVNRSFLAFQKKLDIIFLHAASVVVKDKAHLFVAPSGGGKSTFSCLAEKKGLEVLNDEVCVIKRFGKKFYASRFPCFLPPQQPVRGVEVGGIYFLNKSHSNMVENIQNIDALKRVIPEAVCFYQDKVLEEKTTFHRKYIFSFLNSMIDTLDVRSFHFAKDENAISCLT